MNEIANQEETDIDAAKVAQEAILIEMQTERQDGEAGPQIIDQIEIERNKMI